MRLFVGPLPEHVSPQDVRNFIGSGIRPRGPLALFKKAPKTVSCTMMETPSYRGQSSTYFAIVQIPFPALAERAIKNLNGGSIGNRQVTVREYVDRDSANDRRRTEASEQAQSRRTRERRGHAILRVYRAPEKVVVAPVNRAYR